MSLIHESLLNPDDDMSAYRAKVSFVASVGNEVSRKRYGYSYKDKVEERTESLPYLIKLQRREAIRRALGGGCLDVRHMQLVHDKLVQMSDNCDTNQRKDIHIDSSNKEGWLESHPGCVGREPWEALKYVPCGPLVLGVDVHQKVCEITVPVYSTKEECNVEVEMDVCQEVCNVVLNMTTTSSECNAQLQILKQQCRTCDIKLDDLQRCDSTCNLGSEILNAAKCKI